MNLTFPSGKLQEDSLGELCWNTCFKHFTNRIFIHLLFGGKTFSPVVVFLFRILAWNDEQNKMRRVYYHLLKKNPEEGGGQGTCLSFVLLTIH